MTPSSPELPRWCHRLGKLLPRAIRTRVFEPSCWDLLLSNASQGRTRSAAEAVKVVGYLLAAAGFGLADVLTGRVLKKAIAYAFTLVMLVMVLLLIPWLYHLATAVVTQSL